MARVFLNALAENSSVAQLSAIKHFVFEKIAEVSFLYSVPKIETDKRRPLNVIEFCLRSGSCVGATSQKNCYHMHISFKSLVKQIFQKVFHKVFSDKIVKCVFPRKRHKFRDFMILRRADLFLSLSFVKAGSLGYIRNPKRLM